MEEDIPFETEEELRVRGNAKTPDILLSCPVGVRVRRKGLQGPVYADLDSGEEGDIDLDDDAVYEWKTVCWIDSKVRRYCPFLHVAFRPNHT